MTPAQDTWTAPDLFGTVAIVTGASRGVGRGVALALGASGAVVYVTARSSRGTETTEGLPGTVEDTAEEVTLRGGSGVAIACDHFDDAQVQRVFDRVIDDHGRVDILVNNAWAGYERGGDARFDAPFWDQPTWRWDLFNASLRGQYVSSQLAARHMTAARSGLIANISYTDGETFLGQVAYDTTKTACDRMAAAMAFELRKYEVAACSLLPGFVRTERVEAAWELLGDGPASVVHSPEYVGRAVCALAADPARLEFSGERLAVGDLAQRYGFVDIDGRQPPAFKIEGRMTLATRMERLNRVVARAEAKT